MNRKITILSIAASLLSGAIAYLWYQDQSEREQREASLAPVPELEGRLQKVIPDSETTSPPRKPQFHPQVENDRGEPSERANSSADSPDVRAAKVAAQRPMIETGYMFSELVPALELDAETAESLMNLLSEHLLRSRESPPFVPAGELESQEYDKPEWALKQEEEERRRNAEIATLLGDLRYSAFEDYMDSVEARRLMRQLEGTLAGTPEALAEEQFLPLVRAVAEGQQRYVAERGKYASPSGLEQLARYHERMGEAAQPYLSRGQFEHFSQYLDQRFEAEQTRSKERMSQAEAQQRNRDR